MHTAILTAPAASAATPRGFPIWHAVAAGAAALLLLVFYVITLQASVQRGESLREERRVAGEVAFATRFDSRKPAVEPLKLMSLTQ